MKSLPQMNHPRSLSPAVLVQKQKKLGMHGMSFFEYKDIFYVRMRFWVDVPCSVVKAYILPVITAGNFSASRTKVSD